MIVWQISWNAIYIIRRLEVTSGTGIDVVVHLFDANPATDYIIIKSGE